MDADLFKEYSTDPSRNPALNRWIRDGGKALGYFCAKVPVEIIYAAGFFPVRLLGSRVALNEMGRYFSRYTCYYVKSLLEEALQGKYRDLEGQVFSYDCDCMRFMSETWSSVVRPPYFYLLLTPHSASTAGSDVFFAKELQDFSESLLRHRNRKPGPDDLAEAIHLYNRLRECYRRIEACRTQGEISGTLSAELALYGQLVPPKEAVERLTRVLDEKNFPQPPDGPRLMVLGSEQPDPEFFRLVESLPARIVADDCCTFGRTAQPAVKIVDGDPFLSLSRSYLHEQTQCPYMTSEGSFERRQDNLIERVKKNGVGGVIFAIQRYCDPHQLDYPDLKGFLEAHRIPTLLIETEQAVDTETIKNRLSAFVEILR